MIGAPLRAISRVSAELRPLSSKVPTSRPVMRRPQVAALTKGDGDCPRWARHAPPPILSAISASRVAPSGMRRQRLGEAHQRDALLAGERIFAHQALDQTGRRPGAQALDQSPRQRPRLGLGRGGQRRGLQQRGHAIGLGRAIDGVDRGAQTVALLDVGEELGERRPIGGGRASPTRGPAKDGSITPGMPAVSCSFPSSGARFAAPLAGEAGMSRICGRRASALRSDQRTRARRTYLLRAHNPVCCGATILLIWTW